jgi:hypothetical protein
MFDKSTRTLMAMLFQRGLVTTIDGVVPGTERKFYVYHYGPNIISENDYYTGWISGIYGVVCDGSTLNEALDKLEAVVANLPEKEAVEV